MFFDIALSLILNLKEITNSETEELRNIRKNKKIISPLAIVIDAILHNKAPEVEIDADSDDIILKAAITLANEITSKSILQT